MSRLRTALRYSRRLVAGLAHDFWKDGGAVPDPLFSAEMERVAAVDAGETTPVVKVPKPPKPAAKPIEAGVQWVARPGEISEKMWGDGYVVPLDETFTEKLTRPLGLNKDMSVLDISAGLGTRLRQTVDEYDVFINGLEADAAVAARGMEISTAEGRGKRANIAAYDPMKLAVERGYDCVVAREVIYGAADKEKFIKLIAACCKPQAQVSFTDYVVNPETHDAPAIAAWRAFEKGADPLGLVPMAEIWARAGFTLRVHDDQTDIYKKEVVAGMARLAAFLQSGVVPDAETKKAINLRITTWAHRVSAIEAGMKFYRFYGLR